MTDFEGAAGLEALFTAARPRKLTPAQRSLLLSLAAMRGLAVLVSPNLWRVQAGRTVTTQTWTTGTVKSLTKLKLLDQVSWAARRINDAGQLVAAALAAEEKR